MPPPMAVIAQAGTLCERKRRVLTNDAGKLAAGHTEGPEVRPGSLPLQPSFSWTPSGPRCSIPDNDLWVTLVSFKTTCQVVLCISQACLYFMVVPLCDLHAWCKCIQQAACARERMDENRKYFKKWLFFFLNTHNTHRDRRS